MPVALSSVNKISSRDTPLENRYTPDRQKTANKQAEEQQEGDAMKILKLNDTAEFIPGVMKRTFLVENSPNFKLINFNLDAGVTFPVHSHDLDGEVVIQILKGEGYFLGNGDTEIPAQQGDILVSEIREPHGVRAETQMRILVTIAPPI